MATRQKKNNAASSNEENYDEQLMEKVCEKVVTRFEQILDRKFAEMQKKFSEMSAAIEANKQTISDTKDNINSLDIEQDNIQQMHRKNNVRINGLPESKDENLLESVLKLLRENLKVECSTHDIDEIYRTKKANSETRIRTVIVKFVSYIKKYEVLQARKNLRDLRIGRVTIFEDLTNKRYHILRLAQIKYGKRSVWSFGGKIYTQGDGGRIQLSLKDVQ